MNIQRRREVEEQIEQIKARKKKCREYYGNIKKAQYNRIVFDRIMGIEGDS